MNEIHVIYLLILYTSTVNSCMYLVCSCACLYVLMSVPKKFSSPSIFHPKLLKYCSILMKIENNLVAILDPYEREVENDRGTF